MARPLPQGFKLSEAELSDSEEIWRMCQDAFVEDELWQTVFKNCKKEDIHPWVMNVFPHRWNLPDITFYKITEEATG
jgi:hypothetical protein